MQFTGHPLPVYQFVTVPWDFNPVPYCQPSSPTQSLPITGQRNMQLPPSLEWYVWLGRRSIYNISKSQEKINHLMYIDAKNEKDLETLIHTVGIYGQGIGMEFGIEKCAMLVMKSGKHTWQSEWSCQIKTRLERSEKKNPTNTWASWRRIPSNKWRRNKKIKKEYLRGTRKLLETKLSSRNLIKGINGCILR